MSEVIYEHNSTKDKVIKKDDQFYFLRNGEVTNETIRPEILINGSDWKLLTPERKWYVIRQNSDTSIYFVCGISGKAYHLGDKFTIPPNHSFGDGKRFFSIVSFYISGQPNAEKNQFNFVYAKTKCGKDIHLNDIIHMYE